MLLSCDVSLPLPYKCKLYTVIIDAIYIFKGHYPLVMSKNSRPNLHQWPKMFTPTFNRDPQTENTSYINTTNDDICNTVFRILQRAEDAQVVTYCNKKPVRIFYARNPVPITFIDMPLYVISSYLTKRCQRGDVLDVWSRGVLSAAHTITTEHQHFVFSLVF